MGPSRIKGAIMTAHNKISLQIAPRIISLGGPQAHRLLPSAKRRMVGPFIFFDYFPLTTFHGGEGLDVRPHPHIGLSTLSYLLTGEILHHDSLGYKQILRPGDVNWMTAGKGIAHSERQSAELKQGEHSLQLMQFWVALPKEFEDTEPSFTHHPQSTIPQFTHGKAEVRVVAGEALGQRSPVKTYSPLFFIDVKLPQGERFCFDPQGQELAYYPISGQQKVGEQTIQQGDIYVVEKSSDLEITAVEEAHFVLLGGEAFPEERFIYWNFVSSSKDKIEQAKTAWQNQSFPQVEGEPDIIPLPAN